MDFALTDEQQQIRDEVLKICARFDDAYWLERDRTATYPDAFFAAMAEGNWLGIAMPEEYGGAGLGITEAAILMQAVAESGACMSGASAIHLNIFGLNPVVVFGTEAQKRRMLPPVIAGRDKGKRGTVAERVDEQLLLVEGINVVKKHVKPNPLKGTTGGVIDKTMPIQQSNVALFNPATGKADRVGIKILADGKKVRVFKSSGEEVKA